MPRQPAPPKLIRYGFIDDEAQVIVESVWTAENAIKYLVYHIPTGEFDLADSYVIQRYNLEIFPPPTTHEFLTSKCPVLLPRFNGTLDLQRFDYDTLDKRLKEYLADWLTLSPAYIVVLAAFIKFTWVHERSEVKPYLNIWGDKGTGKSSIVEVALQWTCRYGNYTAGGVSSSALLRHVDLFFGTEFLDENEIMETSDEGKKLAQILRGGYKDSGTYMMSEQQTGGKNFYPKIFNTGCPKVIVGRHPIKDDALRSRCLEMELKPIEVPPEKRRHTEKWFQRERQSKGQELIDLLFLYRLIEYPKRYDKAPDLFGYEARLSDTSQPFYYCLHSDKDRKLYLEFINDNIKELLAERMESMEGKLLILIRDSITLNPLQSLGVLLGSTSRDVRITLQDLAEAFKARFEPDMEDRDFKKFLNPYKVGRKIAGMGLKTKRIGGGGRIIDPYSFDILPELYKRYGLPAPVTQVSAPTEAGEEEKMSAESPEQLTLTQEVADAL